jgi:acetyl-CoA carboxylase carboxyl transferase subunit beta
MTPRTTMAQAPSAAEVVDPGLALVETPRRGIREGLWVGCPSCRERLFSTELQDNFKVCMYCQHHFPVTARERLTQLLDENSFEEWDAGLKPVDTLGFVDSQPYAKRIVDQQKKTGLNDAVICGTGYIRGRGVVIGVTDFTFMAGSMGAVVGEKLARAAERALERRLPLIFVSGSGGGARMQEGILSLMQMAKVSAALGRYTRAGGFYVCVLTHPTMGGVAASWAFQGDVTLAEPKAMIGFAGARTIKNTIRIELPEGFQTSEFLLKHGFVDRIVQRKDLGTELSRLIDFCEMQPRP